MLRAEISLLLIKAQEKIHKVGVKELIEVQEKIQKVGVRESLF